MNIYEQITESQRIFGKKTMLALSCGYETYSDYFWGSTKVPTWDEIAAALRIPEVNDKTDAMGRVIRKNNYSQIKVNKGFNAGKPKGKGKYD